MATPPFRRAAFEGSAFVLSALLFLCCLAFSKSFADELPSDTKKVLYVASHNTSMPWAHYSMDAFGQYFRDIEKPVKVSAVELGVLGGDNLQPLPGTVEKVLKSIEEERPDALVIVGIPAFDTFKKYSATTLKGIPTVIYGCPEFMKPELEVYPDSTYIGKKPGIIKNITLGMELLPGTKEIAVITDAGPAGGRVETEARERLKDFGAAKITFINGRDHSTREMLKMVADMPRDSFVVYQNWRSAKDDLVLSFSNTLENIGKYAKGPVFSLNHILGSRTLGGIMSVSKDDGLKAAQTVEKILDGVPAASIEPSEGSEKPVFNWGEVEKFGLQKAKFPEGSEFIGKPHGMWETHKGAILMMSAIIALLALWLVSSIRRYRLAERNAFIFNRLPIMVLAYDREGRAVFSYAEGLGLGANLRSMDLSGLPEDMSRVFAENIAKVRETGAESRAVFDWDGTRLKAVFALLPENKFGKDTVMAVCSDVTELSLTHNELQNAIEHLTVTINSIGDGIIATDEAGRITIFNNVAEKLTGYGRGEAVGKKLDDIFHVEDFEGGARMPSPAARALETRRTVNGSGKTALVAKNGSERRRISDSAAPITDSSGALHGAILVFRDVTEECVRRDELATKNRLLENAANIANLMCFVCDSNFKLKETSRHGDDGAKYWAEEGGEMVLAEKWIIAEDLAEFRRAWRSLVKGGARELDVSYRSDYSGERRHFNMKMAKVDADDPQSDFVGIIQDITASVQNKLKLKDTTRLLYSILDNIPCAIYVKNYDDGGRYIIANKFFSECGNGKKGPLEGLTDHDIFPKESADKFVENDRKAIEGGRPVEVFETLSLGNGATMRTRTFKNCIRAENGDRHLVGISFDLTELLDAQEALESFVEQERVINACMKTVMADDGGAVEEVLKTMGESLGADRCRIFKFDGGAGEARSTCEWSQNAASSERGGGILPKEDSLALAQALKLRKTVHSDNLNGGAAVNSGLPASLADGANSAMLAGISQCGSLWGFVAADFSSRPHKTRPIEKRMLEAVSQILELYLDRRRSLEKLKASEAEKSLIIDSLNVPILLFDRSIRPVAVNSALAAKFGKAPQDILGTPCRQSFCKRPEGGMCRVKECFETGSDSVFEFRHNDRDYTVYVSPVRDGSGNIINVIEYAMDVTDLNRQKGELVKAAEAAKAANRAKSLFLATVSHELRTPLNSVIGFSELSQDESLPKADRIENLRHINFSANALLSLINDILDISKLEADQLEIVKTPMDVRKLAMEIAGIFKFRAQKQGIALKTDIPDGLPAMMLDSLRIKQVLMNIVGNAVKFTDRGEVKISVSFRPGPEGRGALSLSVKDTGMGIAPEYLERIFEVFERQPSAKVKGSRAYEGTGLGLPIALKLVKKMGGFIDVKSELEKGSVFSIEIPDVETAQGETPKQETPEALRPARDFGRARVMIVDDVPMNLKVLEAVLKKFNAEVDVCGSGPEALERLAGKKPALILTDIWMPGMGGVELAEKIKSDAKTADIPIVAVTADIQMESGGGEFDGVLLKPVTSERVGAMLARFLPLNGETAARK